MKQLENSLRRIPYGKLDEETYEFANIMTRLLHSSTNKGQISDLGVDLIATTIRLWSISQNWCSEDEQDICQRRSKIGPCGGVKVDHLAHGERCRQEG